ncbi:amyloid beta precursor like protein 1 [Homo sapiens]|uniref:Amyloid beta precursor like protein 1 n=1 Tax=Homo sapiens TaxID=9606 RepID=K7EMS1_HUMAN|nr:amyloid beta precursor like protein 1 [Homo sapiens]KAI4042145.1 amyloid beta precursor like protein 1 [Homo sapiens]
MGPASPAARGLSRRPGQPPLPLLLPLLLLLLRAQPAIGSLAGGSPGAAETHSALDAVSGTRSACWSTADRCTRSCRLHVWSRLRRPSPWSAGAGVPGAAAAPTPTTRLCPSAACLVNL